MRFTKIWPFIWPVRSCKGCFWYCHLGKYKSSYSFGCCSISLVAKLHCVLKIKRDLEVGSYIHKLFSLWSSISFKGPFQQTRLKDLPAFPLYFMGSVVKLSQNRSHSNLQEQDAETWSQPYGTEVNHDIDGGHLSNGGRKMLPQWLIFVCLYGSKLLNGFIGKICHVFQCKKTCCVGNWLLQMSPEKEHSSH